MESKDQIIKGLRESSLRELSAFSTYHLLAQREPEEKRRQILLRLAEAENQHSEELAQRIKEIGIDHHGQAQGSIDRIRRRFLLHLGTDTAIKRIETAADRQGVLYQRQQVEVARS